MTLVRTAAGRGYTYTLDGEPVMGVGSLTGGGLPKPALLGWAARSAARYAVDHWRCLAPRVASGEAESVFEEIRGAPFRESNAAAVRGTEIHRYAEALLRGTGAEVPDELDGYVASCSDFLDDWGVRPLLTEALVGSRAHGYAGTVDLVAELPGGDLGLFVYTTRPSGVWPETALHAAAFQFADFYLSAADVEVPVSALEIGAAYGVHLRADGYAVHPLEAGEQTFQRFLDVSAVARAAKGLGALVHGPVAPPYPLKTGRPVSGPRAVRRRDMATADEAAPEPEVLLWTVSHNDEQ
ncbi:hypothetical protein [Streptomyces decoyicus]|uniref:hypothetical protein n=1 Tax=Streptomyces decoyicus TaxID=249567 RepID=UPI003862F564|nr:hypothetical protein OG532_16555 [Streptomyces decoyicus]